MCLCVCAGQYLNLDKDHNGMLSKEELSRYGTATLTAVFLDRVYQECLTYDGEMVIQNFIARIQLFQSIQLKSIVKPHHSSIILVAMVPCALHPTLLGL